MENMKELKEMKILDVVIEQNVQNTSRIPDSVRCMTCLFEKYCNGVYCLQGDSDKQRKIANLNIFLVLGENGQAALLQMKPPKPIPDEKLHDIEEKYREICVGKLPEDAIKLIEPYFEDDFWK